MNSTTKQLRQIIDRHSEPERPGCRESHTLQSLSMRLRAPQEFCARLVSDGILKAHPVYKGSPLWAFGSNQLNSVKRIVAEEIVARAVELSSGAESDALFASTAALQANERHFAYPEEEEKRSPFTSAAATVAKGAAIAGGTLAAGAYIRGRIAAGASKSAKLGPLGTAALGASKLKGDATAVAAKVKDAYGVLRRARAATFRK